MSTSPTLRRVVVAVCGLLAMCLTSTLSSAIVPVVESTPVAASDGAISLPTLSALAQLRTPNPGAGAVIQTIRLNGHRTLKALDFEPAIAQYRGRALSPDELASLRDAVTRTLIEAGFINSGARITPQSVVDGTLEIELVAGTLDRVRVSGAKHFRADYLAKRIRLIGDEPLNIRDIEKRLQWLAAEPLIRRVRAKLEPGLNPGDAVLVLDVRELTPYTLRLFAGNDAVRSIGSEHMRITAGHQNLFGNRDGFEAYLGQSPGLDEWKVNYSVPVTRFDTRMFASYRVSKSRVVHSDVDLDAIRLESRSRTYTVGVEQPLRLGKKLELVLGVRGDVRRARSKVNGFGFFLTPGEDEKGRVRASVLRVSQQISRRSRNSVLSARSTVSIGLDLFSASKGEIGGTSSIPDGTFVSWLGQVYWVGRLPSELRRSQLVVRGDWQIARDPLLGMERVAVGGQRTVRGYPENAVVRDNGFAASVEVRIPLFKKRRKGWSFEVTPFVDGGYAWNRGRSRDAETLTSVGLGLRTRYKERLVIGVEWGKRLIDVETRTGGLQGNGVHLQAEWRL